MTIYEYDYLAEHRGSLLQGEPLDEKTTHLLIGACHASRIVDGGVDSQA